MSYAKFTDLDYRFTEMNCVVAVPIFQTPSTVTLILVDVWLCHQHLGKIAQCAQEVMQFVK